MDLPIMYLLEKSRNFQRRNFVCIKTNFQGVKSTKSCFISQNYLAEILYDVPVFSQCLLKPYTGRYPEGSGEV